MTWQLNNPNVEAQQILYEGIFNIASNIYIQAVTQVMVSIGNGATSASVTISAINPLLVQMKWNGFYTDNATNNPAQNVVRVEFTSSTATDVTFTVFRNTASTSTSVFVGTAVEWKPAAVESITYGKITTANSTNLTIGAVDITRSTCEYLGASSVGTTGAAQQLAAVFLANSTTVTATHGLATVMQVCFCVVQWKAAIITTLENSAVLLANTNSSDTITLAGSFTLAYSMLFYGGVKMAVATYSNIFHAMLFDTSSNPSSNVIVERTGASTLGRTVYFTAVQFIPAFITSLTPYVILDSKVP